MQNWPFKNINVGVLKENLLKLDELQLHESGSWWTDNKHSNLVRFLWV